MEAILHTDEQYYLYLSGMFILISKTDDTKYMP